MPVGERNFFRDIDFGFNFFTIFREANMDAKLKSNAGAENPWKRAVLQVKRKVIAWGDNFAIAHGEAVDVFVEVAQEVASEIAMRLVTSDGLVIGIYPDSSWISRENGLFRWVLSPAINISGSFKIIVFSREVNEVWEIDGWVALPEQKYTLLINGVPADPLARDIYVTRDEEMEVKLVPYNLPELAVSMSPFSYSSGEWECDPLPETPVLVGESGGVWEMKLSGSDETIVLKFNTVIPVGYRLVPGFHDTSTTLTAISKSPHHFKGWVLHVYASRNGAVLPNSHVFWRVNGLMRQTSFTDAVGHDQFHIGDDGPTICSAELRIRDQPHSVKTIQID